MHPRGSALRRVRSVTDDELDELRGCIDLGFWFEPAAGSGCAACGAGRTSLVESLPAVDIYYAMHGDSADGGGAEGCACPCGAASEASSEESTLGSPMSSILSPGDTPETVKMRRWAQVVALSVLNHR